MNYNSTYNSQRNNKNLLLESISDFNVNINNIDNNKYDTFFLIESNITMPQNEFSRKIEDSNSENHPITSITRTISNQTNNNYMDSNLDSESFNLFNSNIFTNNYSIRTSYNKDFASINGIQKIKKYIIDNKKNENIFFMDIFNKKINDTNLMIKSQFYDSLKQYVVNIKKDEANELFDCIDYEKKQRINYNYLLSFYIINQNNKIINRKSHFNINKLFNEYKNEQKKIIPIEKFYECLKSIDFTISKKDILKMFKIYFKDKDPGQIKNIKKNDFIFLISNYIFQKITIQKEEKQKIIKVFKQNANNSNGFLNKKQLKYILNNKLNYNFDEIDKLCDRLSVEYDDLIDCDSFIQYLDKLNLYDNNNNHLINELGLNFYYKLHIKSNKKTIFEKYQFLIPSFFREQQKKLNLLPSSTLIPKKDFNGRYYYEDIKPINNNNNFKIYYTIFTLFRPKTTGAHLKIFILLTSILFVSSKTTGSFLACTFLGSTFFLSSFLLERFV